MNFREYVPRIVYQDMQKKLIIRRRWEIGFGWVVACFIFCLFLYFGSIPLDSGEFFYFRDHISGFVEKAYHTVIVALGSLCIIAILGWILLYCRTKCKHTFFPIMPMLTICSALPPFVMGIFLIRWGHLDTIYSSNLAYAILCLILFNIGSSYQTLETLFQTASSSSPVLFAKSLGVPKNKIVRHYIVPNIARPYCTSLRELLPHLVVESTILEYTFGYSGLMRSALEALRYRSWYYFLMFFFGVLLLLTFFDILFRFIEEYLDYS